MTSCRPVLQTGSAGKTHVLRRPSDDVQAVVRRLDVDALRGGEGEVKRSGGPPITQTGVGESSWAGPYQSFAGPHVPDVHLLQAGRPAVGGACRLAVGGACGGLDRLLADTVQGSGLKHSVGGGVEFNHFLFLSLRNSTPLAVAPPPSLSEDANWSAEAQSTIATPREIKRSDL